MQKDTGFKEFWGVWPRKVGKAAALKAWLKTKPDEALKARIIMAVKYQVKYQHLNLTKKMIYCPHPATWLNAGRWEDEIIINNRLYVVDENGELAPVIPDAPKAKRQAPQKKKTSFTPDPALQKLFHENKRFVKYKKTLADMSRELFIDALAVVSCDGETMVLYHDTAPFIRDTYGEGIQECFPDVKVIITDKTEAVKS